MSTATGDRPGAPAPDPGGALVAVLAGMALVFTRFPKRDEERALRDAYHASDARAVTADDAVAPGALA